MSRCEAGGGRGGGGSSHACRPSYRPPRRLFLYLEQVRSAAAGRALASRAEIDHAMVYLEWVVNASPPGLRSREAAVHNLLLLLYAKQPVEDLLLRYVTTAVAPMVFAASEGRAVPLLPASSAAIPTAGGSGAAGALVRGGLDVPGAEAPPPFDVQVCFCLHKGCLFSEHCDPPSYPSR